MEWPGSAAVVSTVFALGCLAVLVAQERLQPEPSVTEVDVFKIRMQAYARIAQADFMPTLELLRGCARRNQ